VAPSHERVQLDCVLVRLAAAFSLSHPTPPQIYTLSLHDALPISIDALPEGARDALVLHALYGYSHGEAAQMLGVAEGTCKAQLRSEEHTSELQSLAYLVCRLLLEKKKAIILTGTI